ncbi:MAG: type III-B CRISPR module RAMP protein Cmr4 [Candidatus Bathyarchaeia archaeon]
MRVGEINGRVGRAYLMKAITPLHVGAGEALQAPADLILQREKASGVPVIWGSSLRGALRAFLRRDGFNEEASEALFGGWSDAGKAGAISVLDAQLTVMPYPSLFGLRGYATTPWLLSRLQQILTLTDAPPNLTALTDTLAVECLSLAEDETFATSTQLSENGILATSDLALKVRSDPPGMLKALEDWLSTYLPDIKGRLTIIHDSLLPLLLRGALRTLHRVHLDENKKVVSGPWSEELAPPASLFITGLLYAKGRIPISKQLVSQILEAINEGTGKAFIVPEPGKLILSAETNRALIERHLGSKFTLLLGGDISVGRGIVRFYSIYDDVVQLPSFTSTTEHKGNSPDFQQPTTERNRVKSAARTLRQAEQVGLLHELRTPVNELPTLLTQAGLYPTIAYLRRKANLKHYEFCLKALEDRVRLVSGMNSKDLAHSEASPSWPLVNDIISYSIWLKRLTRGRVGGK